MIRPTPWQETLRDELIRLNRKEALRPLCAYVDQLVTWQVKTGLQGVTPDRLVTHHILDCAAGSPIVEENTRQAEHIADIGSGAGFPGLVLAVILPSRRFTLVERRGGRAAFLRSTLRALNLGNVAVFDRDVALLPPEFCDHVTTRALAPLDDAGMQAHLARIAPRGLHFAYKGRADRIAEEAASARVRSFRLSVPGVAAERHLVLVPTKAGEATATS